MKLKLNHAVIRDEMASILARTPWAKERKVDEARSGDPLGLVVAFHNPDRPVIVDWLLSEGLFSSARSALGAVWNHDHHHCIDRWGLKGTIRRLEETRRYETAKLPILPEMVDIWRGCVAGSPSPTLSLSWTLDRRVAGAFCFYHLHGRKERPPEGLIYHRRVERNSILMQIDDRDEAEVLVKPTPHFTLEVLDWPTLEAMKTEWHASSSARVASLGAINPPLPAAA
jgi:hypothetical protein